MFRKLFSSRRTASATALAGAVPPGVRVYAVGDIHGRLDLLDNLLDRIETDDGARPDAETVLLFLGDLIDRGPESAQVVERLMALARARPNTRFLLGNHEEVFLATLAGDVKALKFFCRIGGRETVLSYGFSEEEYQELGYDEILERLMARVPNAHRAFLEGFEDMIILGDYVFVHAGVRPDVALAEQKIGDLRWIRGDFLTHQKPLEKIVVHGHTITPEVEVAAHRIGIDTGAYASGRLTAMGFEGADRWVIDTAN